MSLPLGIGLILAGVASGIFSLVGWLDGYGDVRLLFYYFLVFFIFFFAFLLVLSLYAKLQKAQQTAFYLLFLFATALISLAAIFLANYLIKYLFAGIWQPAFYYFPRNLSFIIGIISFGGISCLNRRSQRQFVIMIVSGALGFWIIHATVGLGFQKSIGNLLESPNILLLTVESLRYDYLECNGNKNVKTPSMNSLSQRGLSFDNYFVQVPYTTASLATLLTGYYPFLHGARAFGQKPDPHHRPFVEKLDRKGYVVKIDGSYFPGLFPQSSGSDVHGSSLIRKVFANLASVVYIVNDQFGNLFPSLFGFYCFGRKTSMRQTSEILRSLRICKNRRWFFWTHLQSNCHWPYEAPPQFARIYGKTKPSKQTARYLKDPNDLNQHPEVVTDRLTGEMRAAYSAEVACIDRQIGFILNQLSRLGLANHTVFILTADHGELLGEHGHFGHGEFLSDELIHVPLFICAPGLSSVRAGRRIANLVEEVLRNF